MKKHTHPSFVTPLLLASSLVLVTACSSSNDNNDDAPPVDDAPIAETPDTDTPDTDTPDTDTPDTDTPDTDTPDTDTPDTDTPDTDTPDTDTPDTDNPDTDNPDTDNPDTDTPNPPVTDNNTLSYGYAFTRSPSFESGQIERISLTDGNVIDGQYPATSSDHSLDTDGKSVYQIGRFNIDNLTKFSATDTTIVDYQLSVLGDVPETSNPQALAFINDDLAYLTRRGSDKILILDPTPAEATSASLITGEISLANYNRGSGETLDLPDMTDAVIVDDKLFVLLENLDGFAPVNSGYIAVIDTQTNAEIATGQSELPLQGIKLQTVNPTALHYNEITGLLYVTGRGNAFRNESVPGDPYTGGIESIDPSTYQTSLLIDDGTEAENKGFFTSAVIISDTKGYAITFDGFNEDFTSISNLRSFNPSTGELSEPVAGTEGQDLTTLTLGPDNHLWVGIQTATPGFVRVNIDTGEVASENIATNQIPADLIFIEIER